MSRYNGGPNQLKPEDVFEEAVGRLEAGEPIDQIVASYPTVAYHELHEMLMIVSATQSMQGAPIPRPSAAKQQAAKLNFLAAAAEMRAKSEPAAVARVAARRKLRQPTLFEQLQEAFQSIFNLRTLRLAPLVLTLAIVLISTSTLVAMAQASVPGDLAYSVKQWIRKQELELSPPAIRELVRQEQERALAEDVKRAAARADNNSAVIQAEASQIFYGRTGRLLKIGAITVLDRYQPDANIESFKPMSIAGDLEPGAQVALVYQILPGQSETVQGIALTVIAPPVLELPGGTVDQPAQLPTGEATTRCTVTQPEGWAAYQVRAGDNLSFIARRGSTTIDDLMKVNCLNSETILIGSTLYVPATAAEESRSTRFCGEAFPESWVEYEVKSGDSLSSISLRTGATIDELKAINCLTSDIIQLGAKLYVPTTE
jgi:LysM repeat protein